MGHLDVSKFMGRVNILQAGVTMLVSLVFTRPLIERGGVRLGVTLLPLFMLCSILAVRIWHDFWVIQASSILAHAITYALHNPSREMLWVKTSKDCTYHAKSWSDIYGNFAMKTVGSQINLAMNSDIAPAYYAVASGWCIVSAIAAIAVGTMHRGLMNTGKDV